MKSVYGTPLIGVVNIGETIRKRLHAIGIFSVEQLISVTPVEAYKKMCRKNSNKALPLCYYLYSLEGAVQNIHWMKLPEAVRKELKLKARN